MKFTPALTQEVHEYLMQEYGESSEDPTALKLGDLSYLGEHLHHGMPTHFWSYPTSRGESWAIVQPYRDTYLISTCLSAPGSEPNAPIKKWWRRLWGG